MINPETRKKLRRFREIKRGYYSFLILAGLLGLSLFGEVLVNSRALVVSYEGSLYFPVYTDFHPGTDFGESYSYETNYRDLQAKWEKEGSDNWLIMPLVPFNQFENHATGNVFKPEPPSMASQHYLGTDTTSRDILARLFLGRELRCSLRLHLRRRST